MSIKNIFKKFENFEVGSYLLDKTVFRFSENLTDYNLSTMYRCTSMFAIFLIALNSRLVVYPAYVLGLLYNSLLLVTATPLTPCSDWSSS